MSASRAVLWDMDGTLIDSEEFHWIAWRNTLALEGITITREQFLSSFGQRDSAPLDAGDGIFHNNASSRTTALLPEPNVGAAAGWFRE